MSWRNFSHLWDCIDYIAWYLRVANGRVKSCAHQNQVRAKLWQRNIEQHLSGFHHNPLAKYRITKMTYLIGNRQQHMKEDWKIVLVFHSSLFTIITTNLEFGVYTRTKMLDYVGYLLYSRAHLCWTRLPSLCQHCHSLTLGGWARISDARSGARRSRAHCGKQRCIQSK